MALLPALDTAARALLVNQAALGVVGNNVANVHTPGYTRQRPDLVAGREVIEGGVFVGTGVQLRSVEQVLDPLLQRRRLSAATDQGQQTALREQLGALAAIANDLQEPSLGSALGQFFDAADALARSPEGLAEREGLLGRATALTQEIRRRSGAIGELQRAIDDQFLARAEHANATLTRVAELNGAIASAEVGGQTANALRDERRSALLELSGLVGVQTFEEHDGSVTVAAQSGTALVTGNAVVHQIVTQAGAIGLDGRPVHEAGLTSPTGSFLAVPDVFARGELAALAAARDSGVVDAATNLDTLAMALRDAVNGVQTDPAAVDLDGNGTTGAPIFGGTGALDLTVALTDPRRIGAALSTEPGDGQNALRLADLRTTAQAGLGGVTFSAYTAQEVGRIGEEAAQARDVAEAAQLFSDQLEQQHLSTSGVSLAEELTSLIKFQHAFSAAAQLVNVGNQLLDDLVNMV